MPILIACLVICAFLFMPYIKRAWERFCFFKKIKKICALRKYKVNIPKPFCAYFKNISSAYDITVDTGKSFYALKMWNEFYRHCAIYINRRGAVMKKRKIADPLSQTGKRTHSVVERRVGSVGGLDLGSDTKNRRVIKLLIVYPKDLDVFFCDKDGSKKANFGDTVCDMNFSTYKDFLINLEK